MDELNGKCLKLNEVVFKSKFDEMTNYHIGKQTNNIQISPISWLHTIVLHR